MNARYLRKLYVKNLEDTCSITKIQQNITDLEKNYDGILKEIFE